MYFQARGRFISLSGSNNIGVGRSINPTLLRQVTLIVLPLGTIMSFLLVLTVEYVDIVLLPVG